MGSRIQKKKNRRGPTLQQWMMMETSEVLERFASLPGAIRVGKGPRQFVYIEGTRPDKVLLVAHSDTVFDDRKREVVLDKKQIYRSAKSGVGIGADDRAGCAILWALRKSGHSLLVPNAEEAGCVGSRFLMSCEEQGWPQAINDHAFAIEFDRCHASDLVFYDVGSPDLEKFLLKHYPGYATDTGAFTDICVLCEKMAGVNISVGYYDQHFGNESLVLSEWQRTLDLTRKMLQTENIPKFFVDPNFEGLIRQRKWGGGGMYRPSGPSRPIGNASPGPAPRSPRPAGTLVLADNQVICPYCEGMMDSSEVKFNMNRCVHCSQGVA